MIFLRSSGAWIRSFARLTRGCGSALLGFGLLASVGAQAQPLGSERTNATRATHDALPPAWTAQRDEQERQISWLQQWREEQCPHTTDLGHVAPTAAGTLPLSAPVSDHATAQTTVFLAEAATLRAGWDRLAQQLAARLGRLEGVWQERFVLAQCPTRYADTPPCRSNTATRESIAHVRAQGSEAWQGAARRLGTFEAVVQRHGGCIGALTLDQWLRGEREHLRQSGEWLGNAVQRLQALR